MFKRSLKRGVYLSATSVLVLTMPMTEEVEAQSSPLPPVTVEAPQQRVQRRAVPQRSSTARSRATRQVRAPAMTQQEPIRYVAPSTSVIGTVPAPYAGGQVGSGTRVGLLGNRSAFDTPFSTTGYTDKLMRDQQSQVLSDVVLNDPTIRTSGARLANADQFMIRGFATFRSDYGFDGHYGLLSQTQPAIENIERVEVLRGPAALLIGLPPGGPVGGTLNLIPKRAGDEPLTRATIGYVSPGEVGTHIDFGRRFGENKEWGLRVNGAYRSGAQQFDNQSIDFSFGSAALDYRAERVRWTADIVYNSLDIDGPTPFTTVLPGFPVPVAPNLTTNPFPRWAWMDNRNLIAASRLEVDVTDNITVFAGVGHGQYDANSLQGNATIRNFAGDFTYATNATFTDTATTSAEAGVRARFDTGPIKHQVVVSATNIWREASNRNTVLAPITTLNIYRPTNVPAPSLANVPTIPLPLNANDNGSIAIADAMSIWNDRVTVILGGRYQDLQTQTFNQTTGAVTTDYRANAFSPAAGVVVKPIENISVYANYIEGLQQGAIAPASAANRNEVFPAAVTTQKEVGTKWDLGGLGVTAAFFEITQPISFTDPVTNRFSFDGEQRNRGVELLLFGSPLPDVRLLGGVALTNGVQTKTPAGQFDGKVAVGVPVTTINLYGEYDLPPAFLPGVTLTGRAIYTSGQYYDRANTQSIPDWVRFDLGARYTMLGWNNKPIVLRANVENVAGTNYWASTARGSLGLGRARTFLVSAQFDF